MGFEGPGRRKPAFPAEARKVFGILPTDVATKSRAGSSAGSQKGKAGRRQPVRARTGGGPLILPIVVGGILAALVIAMIGAIVYLGRPPASQTPTVAGIPCDHLEHTQVHYHAALQILYHGNLTNLPANTGIQTDSTGNATCYYWLHVHANSPNVIHIESPASDSFTLGQFFAVWNQWSNANGNGGETLDSSHLAKFTLAPGETMVTYVDLSDGKGPQVYDGNPRNITLKAHEVVTIEIVAAGGSPTTPPAFTFPSGL
jgi:hypothetical protein